MALICLLFAAAIASAQAGSIAGVVVEANGDPVRKAIVTLTLQGTPRKWATQQTDSSGRFKFENLPAGKYDLRANKGGFGTAIYGAESARELGEIIALDDGETRTDLKLRFIHTSTITGRVLDPDGDPVAGANVSLMRGARSLGQRILTNIAQTPTNERGEFRLTGVQPGQYFLHVSVDNYGSRQAGDSHLLSSQYYGGATESKDASPITIKSGENAAGLDFHLNPVIGVRIAGHVTGIPAPQERNNDSQEGALRPFFLQMNLAPADDIMNGYHQGTGADPVHGTFQFPEVAAGRYRIFASTVVGKVMYSGFQTIDAQPGMGEVILNMTPAAALRGQIVMEGQGELKADLRLTLTSIESQPQITQADSSGAFVFEHVPAGKWTMELTPPPRGTYLKSVHLGDHDIRFQKFLIEPGSDAQLKIVVSTRTASIEGESGSKRAGILVAPIGAFHDLARFYYAVASDEEGKFKINGIAPGRYRVFALEKMAAANFRSPEAADQLGELGEEIDLAEGAHVTVHPKLIPVERAREALP